MHRHTALIRGGSLVAALALLAGVSAGPAAAQTSVAVSDTKPLGNATVQSFTQTDAAGQVVAIGVTFPESLLNRLPQEDTETVLEIPQATAQTPFTHIAVDWNPRGHEPLDVYGKPHFDFHFYTISEQTRAAITAAGDDMARLEKKPDPRAVPAGYVPTPGGVPKMGAHWIDPKSPEFTGKGFSLTFIYGFYDGNFAFAEPMVTQTFLETKPHVDEAIAQPEIYPSMKRFPTRFTITYDEKAQTYTVALTGFHAH
ncbi:hypothetical protein EPN44_13070 [bacterium]|nr:MAG: hypothetical protein EPN44_13070 [bacterium]